MKKRMSVLMNGVLFCISAALVLFLAVRICSGSISFGDIPIGFSENGDVLHFFGELLYISRKDVSRLLSLPSSAAEFCKGFIPVFASVPLDIITESVKANCSSFISVVFGALETFLTIGTNL